MFKSSEKMTPESFTDAVKIALGDHLRASILFGSAAAGDYAKTGSDFNVLLVADTYGMDELCALSKVVNRWIDSGNRSPRLLTEKQLRDSCDVFPIEMLDMKQSHKVLYGADVLAPLEISKANLRHQVEFELRSKLLNLQEICLTSGGDKFVLADVLLKSCSSVLAVMHAALRLYQDDVPADKLAALDALSKHVPMDTATFVAIVAAKNGKSPVNRDDAERLFADYLRQIETVTDAVNGL